MEGRRHGGEANWWGGELAGRRREVAEIHASEPSESVASRLKFVTERSCGRIFEYDYEWRYIIRLPRASHFAEVSSSRSLLEFLLSKNRVDKIRSRRYVCATRCRASECSRVFIASSPILGTWIIAGTTTTRDVQLQTVWVHTYIYSSDKTRKMTFWTGVSRYPSSRWRPRFHHEYAEASERLKTHCPRWQRSRPSRSTSRSQRRLRTISVSLSLFS